MCWGNRNGVVQPWRGFSYTCSTQCVSPWNLELFQPCLSFNLLLTMTTRLSFFFFFLLWKEPTCCASQHPLFAYWAQTILINIARILHFHNDGIEDSICGPSLYRPCLPLFSSEDNSGCCLTLGPGLHIFSNKHFLFCITA